MEAVVLREYGVPEFAEFAEPVAGVDQLVVSVRAATLNAVDVAIAGGRHYLSPRTLPVVPGIEGVGLLSDGRRVYFSRPVPPYGSMARRALVPAGHVLEVPDALEDATAATLGNAGMAALMPMSWRAALQPGETVLILGATGVVGRLALQVARELGAGVVVAAGRDAAALEEARALGADATVRLDGDLDRDLAGDADGSPDGDAELTAAILAAAGGPVDVIVDYTWGGPAQSALRAAGHNARLVQVGDRAGERISLAAPLLRRTGATVSGFMPTHAGPAAMARAYRQLATWVIQGRLDVQTARMPLSDVAAAWAMERRTRRKIVLE